MAVPAVSREKLIADACFLIAFRKGASKALQLAAVHLGEIVIPVPILGEVHDLSEAECLEMNLTIYEPSLAELLAAQPTLVKAKGLQYPDRLCVHIADKHGYEIITNDKPMHKACRHSGIPVRWGLQVLVELVEKQLLKPFEAWEMAVAMADANAYMARPVMLEFKRKIGL